MALRIYGAGGAVIASRDCGGEGAPAVAPHQSCFVTVNVTPLVTRAHCEISVLSGEQANLRGTIIGEECFEASGPCFFHSSDAR